MNRTLQEKKALLRNIIKHLLHWSIYDTWEEYMHDMIEKKDVSYPLAVWNEVHWSVFHRRGAMIRTFDPLTKLDDAFVVLKKAILACDADALSALFFEDPNKEMTGYEVLNSVGMWTAEFVTMCVVAAMSNDLQDT